MTGDHHLRDSDIHVWVASLSPAASREQGRTLSEDELARASRYRFDRDRRRFETSRSILRRILGDYTGTPPERVRLSLGEYGKPRVAETSHRFRFNLSHSGDAFALAITTRHEVGIDLECVRPITGVEQLAAAVFSTNERYWLRQLGGSAKLHFFFRIWTAKEALLKAAGTGFIDDVSVLNVVTAEGALGRRISWRNGLWRLSPVPVENGLVASIAIEDALPKTLRVRQWPASVYRSGTVPNNTACETAQPRG